ncbi:MAG: hypothetical protein AAGA72_05205 [Pseudomonadota bacterium]
MRRHHSRTRRGKSKTVKLASLGVIPACAIGAVFVASAMNSSDEVDANFCYARAEQQDIVAFIDNSVTSHLTEPQRRDLEHAIRKPYGTLKPNGRYSIATTAADQNASIVRADFSICRPPTSSEEQSSIDAPMMTGAQLGLRTDEATAAFEHEIVNVLADALDAEKAAGDSPIIEQLQGISRMAEFTGADRELIVVTDGVQNSRHGRFCSVKGELPSFEKYAKRERYQEVKPRSYAGVNVSLYLVDIGPLPQPAMPFCTHDEIRQFWTDYFYANGARNVEVTPLRQWAGQG